MTALAAVIACLSSLCSRSTAATELLADGGFELAGNFSAGSNTVATFSSWRYFAVGGASASCSAITDAHTGTKAIRLQRNNGSGDSAVDKDTPSLRVPIQAGKAYRATVWAKSNTSSPLSFAVPVYNSSGTYLGFEHGGTNLLSRTYMPYTRLFVAEAGAALCNISFRVNGTGEIIFDDASLMEYQPDAPVLALPVGYTTTRTPRIEWRGENSDGYQVLVTTGETTASSVIWDSGIVSSADKYTTPSVQLPVDTTLYAHARIRALGVWSGWSSRVAPFRVQPLPQPPGILYTYDLNYARSLAADVRFQHLHLASVLQGIVNRSQPQLFANFVQGGEVAQGVDNYWLNRLREPEGWLANKTLQPIANIVSLVNQFRPSINGAVVWDPAVNATSNVASTVAGALNLVPVRYDPLPGSLYYQLVTTGPQLPVVVDLLGKFTGVGIIPDTTRPSSGSTKCDAYIWAMEKYLKTDLCNPYVMGYYVDAYWIGLAASHPEIHTLNNHDYFVSKKGFFWDLSPWGDEKPVDDLTQALGTDLNTLKEIYLTAAQKITGNGFIHTGGFTPWPLKYTNYSGAGGSHTPVASEFETSKLLSSYNSYVDADAPGISTMANASAYAQMPLPERYSQPLPPMPEELRKAGLLTNADTAATATYVLHYVGDYDAAAWVTNAMPARWDSPVRGSVNMGWAVNPNLSNRAAMFFEYAYRTRRASDYFVSGDSGAGYVNPTQLFAPRVPSGLPSGVAQWQRHCRDYFQNFGMSFTGFVINGSAGPITSAAEQLYESFSADGIIPQASGAGVHLQNRMPVFEHNSDLSGVIAQDVTPVHSFGIPGTTQFLMFRSILQHVSYYANLNAELSFGRPDMNYVFCDPQTYSYMARVHLGSSNNRRASYLFDTLPQPVQENTSYTVEIAVRNDGWDTWTGGAGGTFGLLMELATGDVFSSPVYYPLPRNVSPGDALVMQVAMTTPPGIGQKRLIYEMSANNGTEGFIGSGDPRYGRSVTVVTAVPVTLSRFTMD
ncbi:MAG: hypothetical protein ACR2IE_13780 [Candidatus Sumerlaeaceae bacterium]